MNCDLIQSWHAEQFHLGAALTSAGHICNRNRCLESSQSTFLSEMSFMTLKSISYAFTNCSTKRKRGREEKEKNVLIKYLLIEAKLNPNLLNSTHLCSICIISVALIERMAAGQDGTWSIFTAENYEVFDLSQGTEGNPTRSVLWKCESNSCPN